MKIIDLNNAQNKVKVNIYYEIRKQKTKIQERKYIRRYSFVNCNSEENSVQMLFKKKIIRGECVCDAVFVRGHVRNYFVVVVCYDR